MNFQRINRQSTNRVLKILLIFVAYFCAAKFGLAIHALNKFATVVWPPSAIGLAAILLFGPRHWPGIFLGAFLINLVTGAPFLVAGGIACGNTLEALVGAYLCTRAPGFHSTLDRLQDVLRLLFFAGVLSPIVSATIGVSSLWLGGQVAFDQTALMWLQWWVGDMMGILTIAPLLLVFASSNWLKNFWNRLGEKTAVAATLIGINLSLFTEVFGHSFSSHLKGPFIFPALLWASMRFGIPGAILATFVTAVVAIAATLQGVGPFVEGPAGVQLVQLAIFVTVVTMIDLVVAVIGTEREAERKNLDKSREALALALGSRDEFMSIASHELKTPLTALKLRLQLNQRALKSEDLPSPRTERSYQSNEVSLRQVEILINLVNGLLDVSRIRSGNFDFTFEEVNLADLIRDVVGQFSEPIKISECSVTLNLEDDLIGYWDKHRIEQVIINLISNAIKYAAKSKIRISAFGQGTTATLTVEDTGPGIDPVGQEKIFDRFERGAAHNQDGGLGLGLFIVKKIIESHEGTIQVQSRLGEGGKIYRRNAFAAVG